MAAPKPKPAQAARAVRFVLGGELRELDDVDPNLTVLRYLREVERRTGTKEGCAEGDCGACTVVLGELEGGVVRYRAVNSCIQFVPVLDGKQLITVEDLQGPDGALHPVQAALVECHGSQCGFCTPGIVMSLFALLRADAQPSPQAIDDALAGNLCRCTGYRPIVEAARRMYEGGRDDRFSAAEAQVARLLRSLRRRDTFAFAARGRRYLAPRTGDALARLLRRHPQARLLAGGTDIGLWVTKEHRDLDILIYTGEVKELKQLRQGRARIEIGAAVPYREAMGVLAARFPPFGELLRRFACVQIRNLGTLGGNIANASPIGDTMPALIALGSSVILRRGAKRRELALEDFFTGYRETALGAGEFIERIDIPLEPAERRFAVYKISKRFDQDISGLLGAFSARLGGGRARQVRICFGGMAATPKRARAAEGALEGSDWSAAALEIAARALEADFEPISDMRASADYRMLVAKNLLRKFWMETTGSVGDVNTALYGRPA